MLGTVCPHFAHIRKTNPRDVTSEFGKPQDNLIRMIMRRGIAYGPVLPERDASPRQVAADRGLMFLCYGATIEDQFEFLTRRWSNSAVQPNDGGHDPVIGQSDVRGHRGRVIDIPMGEGKGAGADDPRPRLGAPDRRRLLLRTADLGPHDRYGRRLTAAVPMLDHRMIPRA